MNDDTIIIEVFTSLTLNYSLQAKEYRDYFYPVLRKLLSLNKKGDLPINIEELSEELLSNAIPVKILKEILDELEYFGILAKNYTCGELVSYQIM